MPGFSFYLVIYQGMRHINKHISLEGVEITEMNISVRFGLFPLIKGKREGGNPNISKIFL